MPDVIHDPTLPRAAWQVIADVVHRCRSHVSVASPRSTIMIVTFVDTMRPAQDPSQVHMQQSISHAYNAVVIAPAYQHS